MSVTTESGFCINRRVRCALGAIAQAVANVALARQTGVFLKGLVLNCVEPVSEQDIENWTPEFASWRLPKIIATANL